jgi:hypothetical protein
MMTRYFSLISIITFRFWQFRDSQRNALCEVIIFGIRDMNVTMHEMFGNELGELGLARRG